MNSRDQVTGRDAQGLRDAETRSGNGCSSSSDCDPYGLSLLQHFTKVGFSGQELACTSASAKETGQAKLPYA